MFIEQLRSIRTTTTPLTVSFSSFFYSIIGFLSQEAMYGKEAVLIFSYHNVFNVVFVFVLYFLCLLYCILISAPFTGLYICMLHITCPCTDLPGYTPVYELIRSLSLILIQQALTVQCFL